MKTTPRIKLSVLLSSLTLVLAAACNQAPIDEGGDDDSGQGQGSGSGSGAGAGNPGGSGSVSFECCINGAGYACPSNDALNQCIGFDIDGCMAACAFDDFACMDDCFYQWETSTPDPSACQPAPVDCNGGGGNPSGGGGLCVGDWDGTYCDVDSDCSTYNCVNDQCYGNEPGNPCEVDSDCSTYNCFQGCCYGNGAGEPCDVDSDCSSYNCYANECQ